MAVLAPDHRKQRFRFVSILAAILLVICTLAAYNAHTADQDYSEYDVKAAYVVSFAKYVEWPENTFPDSDTPLRIGVFGKNPFGDTLESLAEQQDLDGRKLEVLVSDEAEKLLQCQIVFIGGTDRSSTTEKLQSFEKHPVLTVGERKDFAKDGGAVNFVIVETKVKFEINVKSAKEKKLKLSSRLLNVAVRLYE